MFLLLISNCAIIIHNTGMISHGVVPILAVLSRVLSVDIFVTNSCVVDCVLLSCDELQVKENRITMSTHYGLLITVCSTHRIAASLSLISFLLFSSIG